MKLQHRPKLVAVCSPLGAPTPEGIADNIERAKLYCRLVLEAGHVPYASHVFYPALGLDDDDPDQRAIGLAAGLAEFAVRDELWFWGYPSAGMRAELQLMLAKGKRCLMWDPEFPTQYLGDLKRIDADGNLVVKRELVFLAPVAA